MVTTDRHDATRAAATLLASAASGSSRSQWLQAVVLGAVPAMRTSPDVSIRDGARLAGHTDPDRCAAIACVLADWLAEVLRDGGTDPREFARQIVAESIAAEASQAAEGTP